MGRKSIWIEAHENDFLARHGRLYAGVGSGIFPNGFVNETVTVTASRSLTGPIDDSFVHCINENLTRPGVIPAFIGKGGEVGKRHAVQGTEVLLDLGYGWSGWRYLDLGACERIYQVKGKRQGGGSPCEKRQPEKSRTKQPWPESSVDGDFIP